MNFYYQKISENIECRITGISYPASCDVSLDELRYVKVLHYDFDENIKSGELIVNVRIASETIDIFKELFIHKYPINKMVLIDEYGGDDEKSMADNNTSCFNYRTIDSSSTLSLHSYGLAIDINPLYNPYIRIGFGDRNILPVNASEFTNRTLKTPGIIKKGDVCYNAFIYRGWKWGGEWTDTKDYQHFYKKLMKN